MAERRFLGDGMAGFRSFFRKELLPRFENPQLARQSDSALLEPGPGRYAATTDAFIVDPLVFPGGNIGTLAFCGTANDLLTECARPEVLLMSLLVGDDLPEQVLGLVLDAIRDHCEAAGAQLVGGDTKSLPPGGPGLVITMAGFGRVQRSAPPLGFEHVEPGDEVVITGPVGAHAIAVLSRREGLGFEQVVTSDCRDLGPTLWPIVLSSPDLRALRDASRGGLLAVLHEFAAASGCDVELDSAAVPVQHEVTMAAELLGLDPFELANEGCAVLFTRASTGADLVTRLRSEHGLSQAALVGTVRPGSGHVLLRVENDTRVAVQSMGTGIPRLC